MALKTPEEYKDSLRKMRPNVYKFGELIKDLTTHSATKRCIEGHAQLFAAALDPQHAAIASTTSTITGEEVSRYLSVNQTADDMIANCRLKRLAFNLTGTCTGARCAGYAALNTMWPTTYDMDKDLGTDYHQRLRDWLKQAQAADITIFKAELVPVGEDQLPMIEQAREMLKVMRDAGVQVGLGTHIPEVIDHTESKGWDLDFYMTCFYSPQPAAHQSAVLAGADAGEVYLDEDRDRMCRTIRATPRTCLAFKILAASRNARTPESLRRAVEYVMEFQGNDLP